MKKIIARGIFINWNTKLILVFHKLPWYTQKNSSQSYKFCGGGEGSCTPVQKVKNITSTSLFTSKSFG